MMPIPPEAERAFILLRVLFLLAKSSCQRTRTASRPGGVSRIRTGDLLYAKQMLYQLSYNPLLVRTPGHPEGAIRGVGLGGVEPPTSRLSGVRSNHLSYSPGQPSKVRLTRAVAPYSKNVRSLMRKSLASPADSGKSSYADQLSLGGDPAARSRTATLLRLSPSHLVYLRPLPP